MAQRLLTYKDIVDAIMETIGANSSDTGARNKIKRLVNMNYIDEVAPFKRWVWLQKSTSVVHKAYYNVGTVSVTPLSTTVTLSTAPNASEGSFANYKFSVDGSNAVYTVTAHTAESTTLTLNVEFQETLNATAKYKIWRDRIDLPTDAKETTEIWHAQLPQPLLPVGPQAVRKLEAASPKQEGYPQRYSTGDYFDPSSGTPETESDRYRQTRIYPAITQNPITLNIDYIQEVTELSDDTDEPLLPYEDRVVLYYGAGAQAWSVIARNEEMSDKFLMKYQAKLARMAGDRDEGIDTPTITPNGDYINSIRRAGLRRNKIGLASAGGSSTAATPSYLKDVIIDGATLRNDMTVETGVLIAGRDIAADGVLLDGLTGETTVTLTDNTTNQAAATWALATYDTIHIRYSISRNSSTYEAGTFTMIGHGSTIAYSQGGVVNVGDPGVTLSADISGGNLRLLATTTNTGVNATLKFEARTWLSW